VLDGAGDDWRDSAGVDGQDCVAEDGEESRMRLWGRLPRSRAIVLQSTEEEGDKTVEQHYLPVKYRRSERPPRA
jgi:hypothetical protein